MPLPSSSSLPIRTDAPAARWPAAARQRGRLAQGFVLGATLWLAACAASQPTAPPPDAAAASATAASPGAAVPDPRVLGLWKIEQARAAPIVHKLNARINFGKDGQLSANGGCNSIATPYTLAGNRLKLGSLAITRKACNEVLMEQEDRIITALERAVGAAVPPHGLLELSDENGTVLLRATRVASDG